MHKVKELLAKLAKYHWSPEPPRAYTLDSEGRQIGIGKIAQNNPAAFNIAWAGVRGDLSTFSLHRRAVHLYTRAQTLLGTEIAKNVEVADMVTLCDQIQFTHWYQAHRYALPKELVKLLDESLDFSVVKHD